MVAAEQCRGDRALNASGVTEASARLDELFPAQMTFAKDPGDLLDLLVRECCFDLRNRKLRLGTIGILHPTQFPPLGRAFVPRVGSAAGDGRPVRPALSADRWGAILVTSQPPLQPVTIGTARASLPNPLVPHPPPTQ